MKNNILTNIQNAILNQVEGADIVPCCNGGIQVNVEDSQDIAAILCIAGEMMGEYGGEDIQITTNQKEFEVYIDILEGE